MHREHLEQLVAKDLLAVLVLQEYKEPLDHQVQLDLPVHRVTLDHQAALERLERLELKDLKEVLVQLVQLEVVVQLGLLELLVQLDHLVLRVIQDLQDCQEQQAV